MSLTLSLNNALNGLNINQQSLAVLSQNIANANTAGYSRKIINQQSIYLDGLGAGAEIIDINRKVDEYILKAMRMQGSISSRAGAVSDYYDRTQLLIGNPGAGNSIDVAINKFLDVVHSLAQTPEDSVRRVNVINGAKGLAQQTQQLALGLQNLRLQADQDISDAIRVVNDNILNLKQLNLTITEQIALGKPVTELLDRRDVLVRDLAQYVDISIYTKSNGAINITTAGSISLLDEAAYRISYSPASSVGIFIEDATLAKIEVERLDAANNPTGDTITLVTSGKSSQVVTALTSGKIKGLLELRDSKIPNLLAQLDALTAKLRDQVNRIHNNGIAYPGAYSYTGTRAVSSQDFSQWSGQMRLAVLGSNGQPVTSPYSDETSGIRPLLLDLANLDTGLGAGNPSVEGIIKEINQYYGIPKNKAVVGNLNNIKLVSDSTTLPGAPPQFEFDFELENISGQDAEFFVTDVTVLDDTNTDITSLTTNVPQITLAATGTYTTTAASQTVTVTSAAAHGLSNGDTIFLSTPSGAVDGIPAAQLGGYFTVSNVTGTTFDITAATPATAGGSFNEASQTATPSYATMEAGDYGRTKDNGLITADLSANSSSDFYTVNVNVAVKDEDGNLSTSQLTYRITNGVGQLLNTRYAVQAVTDDGVMVVPTGSTPIATAMLVDADGNELPRFNGQYTTAESGFLKIVAGNSSQVIAIDSLDSNEEGQPNNSPPVDGTDRGFSWFFGLNNFFDESYPADGDNITGSALGLTVQQRLIDNPNLISLGSLVQSAPPANTALPPLYTYERQSGDNSIIQQMAGLSTALQDFASTGGLGSTSQSLSAYAASIMTAQATLTASAKTDKINAETLADGYKQRSDSISGVNLDQELGNTIIYQNSYAASSKIISTINQMFEALLGVF